MASIILPESLLDTVSGGGAQQRLSFSVFEDDALFQPRSVPEEFQGLEVGSVVISATLYGYTVSGVEDTVSIQLEKTTVSPLQSNRCRLSLTFFHF